MQQEMINENVSMQAEEQTTPEFALDIKYNGELMSLDREKAVELAQKGMNYDHVYEELMRLREQGEKDVPQGEQTTPEAAAADQRSDARLSEFVDFFKRHPDIKGMADIPHEVVESIAEGRPIEEAFLAGENRLLRGRLAELESREKSPGSLRTDGWDNDDEAFVNMLLAKL